MMSTLSGMAIFTVSSTFLWLLFVILKPNNIIWSWFGLDGSCLIPSSLQNL
jgi:hypothetical protein